MCNRMLQNNSTDIIITNERRKKSENPTVGIKELLSHKYLDLHFVHFETCD
jgi:hypothetical protein